MKIATLHASQDPKLASTLSYRHKAAEDLVREGAQFDLVCAMEVVEHVDDPKGFLRCLADLTKVGETSLSHHVKEVFLNICIGHIKARRSSGALHHFSNTSSQTSHHHCS